jgi:DNA-binding transcriptional MocR family regulator
VSFFPANSFPRRAFLAKQLGVSRMTVINAYDQLLAEGYLEAKAGAGTFVAEHLPEEFLQSPRLETNDNETEVLPRHLRLSEMWIIEDDYDSEFRYEGRPLASLQGLDCDGRVLYIGTFSKTIFAALRLGCLVVPKDLVGVFTAVRALGGLHPPLIEQATLAEFITEGYFTRHLRRMRKLYQERQEILINEIKKHLAGRLEVEKSVSGMHIIGWLPEGISDTLVAERAAQCGIKTAAVSAQSLTEGMRGGLILGYTATSEAQIKKGVRQLIKAMDSLDNK